MTDVKLTLKTLKKDVLVSIPDGGDLTTAFNETTRFVRTLEANNQIRDRESGLNPSGATHEVIKEANGDYRLRRFRFR